MPMQMRTAMMQLGTTARWIGKLAAALWVGLAASAAAVVIDTGDGSGNTSPPGSDPGFANIGDTQNSLSAVYLGDGWVMTAAHVGVIDVGFNDVWYSAVAGSGVRIENPDTTNSELLVYRIAGFPNLPSMVLPSVDIQTNDEVTCIGYGWNRWPDVFHWDGAWNEVEDPPWVYSGYKRNGGGVARWGKNIVSAVGGTYLNTTAFNTTFDESGGVADESLAVSGDSGGGCFIERGGSWELVGLMYARIVAPNQPNTVAVFGNQTISANLFEYRDEILAATPPPPEVPALPGAWGPLLACSLLGAARRRMPDSRRAGRYPRPPARR